MPAQKESSIIARVAFGLSILSTTLSVLSLGFSWYQWSEARDDARKNASIEISKTYLSDPEISKRYALFLDFKSGASRDNEVFLSVCPRRS
jgi:hypothetical protein